jgi:hypothetical protein
LYRSASVRFMCVSPSEFVERMGNFEREQLASENTSSGGERLQSAYSSKV